MDTMFEPPLLRWLLWFLLGIILAGANIAAASVLIRLIWGIRRFHAAPLPRPKKLRSGDYEIEFTQRELTEEFLARIKHLEEAVEYLQEGPRYR